MLLYLLAILPPEPIDIQVNIWKTFMLEHYGCRVAMKSPAHITLIPPFRLADESVEGLQQLLQAFASRFNAFDVQLKDFAAFAPGVIYVDVINNRKLEDLKNALEDELISHGYPIRMEDRSFHPHVTIANRDLKKQDFPNAWHYFKSLSYSEVFNATEITLLKHNGQRWMSLYRAILP